LFTYLPLKLPSDLFPSGFSTKIMSASLLHHKCHMPCPSDPPWCDHHTNIWSGVWSWALHYAVFSILLLFPPLRPKHIP